MQPVVLLRVATGSLNPLKPHEGLAEGKLRNLFERSADRFAQRLLAKLKVFTKPRNYLLHGTSTLRRLDLGNENTEFIGAT